MIRRLNTLQWCPGCKTPTSQVRLNIDTVWRCRHCGIEITVTRNANPPKARPSEGS